MAIKNILKLAIVVILILISANITKNIYFKISYPEKYKEYVEKYAEENEIEKELIYAIIKAESNFKAEVISNKNAIGLMQLLESTAKEVAENIDLEITKEDLLNPEINIKLGAKYIAYLMQKYENKELAIAAYNAGIGNVDKWIEEGKIKSNGTDIENIPFKETNNYVRKVMRDYKIYIKLYR